MQTPVSLRALGAVLAGAGTLLALAAPPPAAARALISAQVVDPTAPLAAAAALVAWALVGWLALGLALAWVSRRQSAVGRLGRAALRRLVPASLAVFVAVAGPAAAAQATHSPAPSAPPSPTSAIPLEPVPADAVPAPPPSAPTQATTTPAATTPPANRPPADAPPPAHPVVVVAPGDSLWRLAAQRLGPAATTPRVAQTWPRWWTANRGLIGSNPDLIHPGQRLVVPAPSPAQGEQ